MGDVVSARLNMKATVIRGGLVVDNDKDDVDPNASEGSGGQGWHYEWHQDPDSGAIVQVKVIDLPDKNPNLPGVQDDSGNTTFYLAGEFEIDCMARGVIDGGIRVAGTTEIFGKNYNVADWVKITFPADVVVTRRDKITNIRHKENGLIIWIEEEAGGAPTVFNVQGVTPVVDPFGNHIENFALLERQEVQ